RRGRERQRRRGRKLRRRLGRRPLTNCNFQRAGRFASELQSRVREVILPGSPSIQPERATMRGNDHSPRPFPDAAFAAVVLLALASIQSPVMSAESPVPTGVRVESARPDLASPASPPVGADRFGWFWTFLENTLHSRARMLQFGVIGMCIALYF